MGKMQAMDAAEIQAAEYKILDRDSLPEYLATIPAVVNILGGVNNLQIDEIGDGNLNFVFRVSDADDLSKSVIVKQAVPYLRMVGESWPLARDRMRYEIRALSLYNELVPDFVPEIFYADEDMSILIMQCLSDHIILRIGMIDGVEYPLVAEHIGRFMAETLFKTSAWSMGSIERRELMDKFTMNSELCKLTEEFIFTFPYMPHESNYSNEKLDVWVKENIHTDFEYKQDVLKFKELFLAKPEALLHGDLHSGSMMVNQAESYVIDMEFAFFGPISFDVGKVFANFLLCCTSHFNRTGGEAYRSWLLDQLEVIWSTFESTFMDLWEKADDSALYSNGFLSLEEYKAFRQSYMVNILQDATGFAACSMARRTIGIAGVADIRDIEDIETRATLEITNLKMSKLLMKERQSINSSDEFLAIVRKFYTSLDI